jgi:hypothetical protein
MLTASSPRLTARILVYLHGDGAHHNLAGYPGEGLF